MIRLNGNTGGSVPHDKAMQTANYDIRLFLRGVVGWSIGEESEELGSFYNRGEVVYLHENSLFLWALHARGQVHGVLPGFEMETFSPGLM